MEKKREKDPEAVKRGKRAKRRGKVGEREVAKLIESHGFSARRGQQFSGGDDSPDVISSIDNCHIEVKRTESLSLYKAMEQAENDATPSQYPTIWHRRNGKEWLVILKANDFLELNKKLIDLEEI